ncbi:hypothetical protein RIF29_05713 [Crotalaria pallida]|uniref:Uncharacterized protein n=1 Tax=Crotalaria pallida TaxID=3830 RepID=A0AAN9J2C5_CROPI
MVMNNTQLGSPVITSQSPKPRHHNRKQEVSSLFLSSTTPNSTNSSANLTEYVFPLSPSESHSHSHSRSHSPLRRKIVSSSSSDSSRSRHKNTEEHGLLTRHQLWPSSSSSSFKRNSGGGGGTLADHITEDRFIEHLEFDNEEKEEEEEERITKTSCSSKENNRPIIGGSVKKPSSIVPRRLSLSSGRNSCSSLDSESDYSDASSFAAASATTTTTMLSSRKMGGGEVSSKYMSGTDVKDRRSRRRNSDSNILDLNNDSSALKKLALKTTAIKRANSLNGIKNSKSQWALSPGRSGSPSMSVESMDKPMSFSSLKQPTSPTKAKGVEKFLSMGFDRFKSKKSLFNSPSSPRFGNMEAVHQLRMLDNRLMQWRYANARAQAVNKNISYQAGMKLLKAWSGMERQHLSAITVTKESLHSVVCRVPLLEGAKVDIPSASIALRRASDLTVSITSMLTRFSPTLCSEFDKTAAMLSELAKVVAQEKQLLQAFFNFFQTISVYEPQEKSMKCNLIQLEGWHWKYRQQKLLPQIAS